MSRVHFSPTAKCDLQEILRYIARDKPRAAVSFVAQIKRICSMLGRSPYLGTKCDELQTDLRYYTHGNYVIYYRIVADGINVARVVHGARDQSTLF